MDVQFPFYTKEIILASASPRRRYLLELIGIRHKVIKPEINEEDQDVDDPAEHVLKLSHLKAHQVAQRVESGIVVGADTIVVFRGEILGKPRDQHEAISMLGRLAGRWHEVYTGLTVIETQSHKMAQGYERTRVKMRKLTPEEIQAYVATGEPMDKAGSYGIQGIGAGIVEKVYGCYFNVVGLPIVRLLSLLREIEEGREVE